MGDGAHRLQRHPMSQAGPRARRQVGQQTVSLGHDPANREETAACRQDRENLRTCWAMGAWRASSPSDRERWGEDAVCLLHHGKQATCELLSALFRLPRKVAAYGSRKWKPFTACRHFCPWVESLFCFHNVLGASCTLRDTSYYFLCSPGAHPMLHQSGLSSLCRRSRQSHPQRALQQSRQMQRHSLLFLTMPGRLEMQSSRTSCTRRPSFKSLAR